MLILVYKDFLLQRGAKSFIYLFVMPVVSAFALSSDILYVILPYIAGSYLYIVYANALDDKFSSERIFLSMPVKRSTIVGAKYLGMFAYMVVFIAAIALLSFLTKIIVPDFNTAPIHIRQLIVQFLTIASIYYSIFFPIYFCFGYQKSRWANYISMLLSGGLYAAATRGLSSIRGIEITSLQASLEYLTGIQSGFWDFFLPLLSAAAVMISIRLSTHFFSRREF